MLTPSTGRAQTGLAKREAARVHGGIGRRQAECEVPDPGHRT